MNIQIPCKEMVIEQIDDVVKSFLKCLSGDVDRRLVFAIHELIINAFEATLRKYNDQASNYPINLYIKMEENVILVEITDQGDGMAHHLNPIDHKQLEEVLLQDRGRGLLMVKKMVDKISFLNEGKGFKVSIEKRR
ncbi:ATP-binding protein [Litchfieldia salsa]|uniref:Histidine kinase-like ATPase domain-containing protein n=1 Tax=Litchfieldia salsa TaxID=930152 RepID=A0A1H0USI6_9BACI|nr:ATP-binding protein [Litchfieldia salsa]SDP69164.1 Histidine kinase-like ATPase domain-containing protein [Litchfieldia salsa]